MNFNQTILVGNLCKDPETRQVGDSNVCKIRLAVNEYWKDAQGQKQQRVMYINVEFWNKLADVVQQYTSKGSSIMVVGKLQLNEYQDRNGVNRSEHYIRADSMQLGNSPDSNGSNNGRSSYAGSSSGGYGSGGYGSSNDGGYGY